MMPPDGPAYDAYVFPRDAWGNPVRGTSMTEPLPAPPPDEQPEDPDNDDAGDEPVEEGA